VRCCEAFQHTRLAVIKVQSVWRGLVVRRELDRQHTAATRIQARWRCYYMRTQYLVQRSAVLVLQWHVKAWLERKRKRRDEAATRLQAAWKGYKVRVQYRQTLYDVVKIQSAWRGVLQRRRYVRMRGVEGLRRALSEGSWEEIRRHEQTLSQIFTKY